MRTLSVSSGGVAGIKRVRACSSKEVPRSFRLSHQQHRALHSVYGLTCRATSRLAACAVSRRSESTLRGADASISLPVRKVRFGQGNDQKANSAKSHKQNESGSKKLGFDFPSSICSKVSDEVKHALNHNRPVVALETTIYTHGFPYPDNVALALGLEDIVRQNGAVPATIGILNGVARIGLNKDEITELASSAGKPETMKVSRRDLPYILGMVSLLKSRLNTILTNIGIIWQKAKWRHNSLWHNDLGPEGRYQGVRNRWPWRCPSWW